MKLFTYPIPIQHLPQLDLNRLEESRPVPDVKPLTGLVQGIKASDLEERFARGLQRIGLRFCFQYKVPVAGSLPGRDKVVDFLVDHGFYYPVEIDGLIAHRTTAQKGKDLIREILLNHAFIQQGIQPIQRVKWWQLENQEMADRKVRELFGGIR